MYAYEVFITQINAKILTISYSKVIVEIAYSNNLLLNLCW